MKLDKNMTKYSVLLLYPDSINDTGHETYYGHVEAENPLLGIEAAVRECCESNQLEYDEYGSTFIPLLILEGHHYGL